VPFTPQVLPPSIPQPQVFQPQPEPSAPPPAPPTAPPPTPAPTTTTVTERVIKSVEEQVGTTFIPMRVMRRFDSKAKPTASPLQSAASIGKRFALGCVAGVALATVFIVGVLRGGSFSQRWRSRARQASVSLNSRDADIDFVDSRRSPTGDAFPLLEAAAC